MVRAQTVTIPCAPIQAAHKNNQETNKTWRKMSPCRGESRLQSKISLPQNFFDGAQPPPKPETPVAPVASVTTAYSPTAVAHGLKVGGIAIHMRPFGQVLEPVQTRLSSFVTVVNYRHYRLAYTTPFNSQAGLRNIYESKAHIEGLYHTLGVSGLELMALQYVLSNMMEGVGAFENMKVSPSRCFQTSSRMM